MCTTFDSLPRRFRDNSNSYQSRIGFVIELAVILNTLVSVNYNISRLFIGKQKHRYSVAKYQAMVISSDIAPTIKQHQVAYSARMDVRFIYRTAIPCKHRITCILTSNNINCSVRPTWRIVLHRSGHYIRFSLRNALQVYICTTVTAVTLLPFVSPRTDLAINLITLCCQY